MEIRFRFEEVDGPVKRPRDTVVSRAHSARALRQRSLQHERVDLIELSPRRFRSEKYASNAKVAMRMAIFNDPYKLVEESKRFHDSRCQHSPYDAIVREGTIVESSVVQLQGDTMPAESQAPQ